MDVYADVSGNNAEPGSTQINNVSLNTTYTTDDLDRACLHALRCPNTLEVKIRLKEKDKLRSKSIKWVLQNAQYKRWKNDGDVSLLWIKGGAGKGKTMISIGLTEQLEWLRCPGKQPPVMTYFFCQNTNYELNTIEGIIKGLILCLVNQEKELCEPLRRLWDHDKKQFKKDLSSWRALWTILLDMLHRCKSQRIYVVIDALDECQDQDMAAFLRLIVMVSLELNSSHVSDAVKSYVAEKTAELDHRHHYGSDLLQQLKAKLTVKAEETYLWVSLVAKRLEGVGRADVLATIEELPPGLTPLYRRILEKLCEEEKSEVEASVRLLKVMLVVYRPLRAEELRSATGLDLEDAAMDRIVDRCASFIKSRGATIEFVHQSARDYLAQETQTTLNLYGSRTHGEIALSCLRYLSQQLKVNLLNLPRPDTERVSIERVADRMGIGLLNSLDYAATFWVQHLADAGPIALLQPALDDYGQVITFLGTKLLEWIECLSLLDQLPRGTEALKDLAYVINLDTSSWDLMQDAMYLLQQHYYIIETWPLQVYSSALVFSPLTSVVRINNLDKIPRWLKTLPQVEAILAIDPQTLEDHRKLLKAIALSPDGQQIASNSWGENIELWDATTGDCMKTLEGHPGGVTTVAFSPDGKLIASGSCDSNVKLWDATTGDCMKTLEGHIGGVTTVAFSPDGKLIASGSCDRNVKLWDATTGDCKKTLKGHSSSVTAVTFSPDGKHIASGSGLNPVKLWDEARPLITSRVFGNTISSHLKYRVQREIKVSEYITSMRYSEDSRKIITNAGALSFDDTESDTYSRCFTSSEELWVDDMWLCYGTVRLLRFPWNLRPNCHDAHGGHVVVGLDNRHFLTFEIDREILVEEMDNMG